MYITYHIILYLYQSIETFHNPTSVQLVSVGTHTNLYPYLSNRIDYYTVFIAQVPLQYSLTTNLPT